MTNLDLCYLPAHRALELFKSRELSPVELMQAVIDRAEAVEPHINAFSYTYYEEALERAKRAETAYGNGSARPLEGIPFAVKDESSIAGWPTSNGSLLLKDYVPEETSLVVERVLEAGAIVHARTTTPEFSSAVTTWSKLWGVTRNPWNSAITPGGSTGGGAAALAAGSTTLINGTDIGGSIRVPASMCGLVGFKPPHGRNPEDPPWNTEQYTHHGPLGRDLTDTILLQNIMSGPHRLDMVSLKPKVHLPQTYPDIKGLKIGYSLDLGYKSIDPEVAALFQVGIERFQQAGALVEPVELGWDWEALESAINRLAYGMMGAELQAMYAQDREALTPYVRALAERSLKVGAADFFRAEQVAAEMFAKLAAVFDSYDLLLCPCVASTEIAADYDYGQGELTINGQAVDPKFGWVLTYPFNSLNRCPVLVVPAGRASNNVPVGLQLVAPPYEDGVVFRFARAYEAVCAGPESPFISINNRPEI